MKEPKLHIPKYSENEVKKFINEDKFMDAYVELLKQTINSLWEIVTFKYCDKSGETLSIGKEDAVLGGNLIRLLKLNTSYLQNICEEGKSEYV
jgi:hypothetical protein